MKGCGVSLFYQTEIFFNVLMSKLRFPQIFLYGLKSSSSLRHHSEELSMTESNHQGHHYYAIFDTVIQKRDKILLFSVTKENIKALKRSNCSIKVCVNVEFYDDSCHFPKIVS